MSSSVLVPPPRTLERLLRLTWQYRAACLTVLLYQVLLLVLSIGGLRLLGLCVDLLRHALDTSAPPPAWPLGFEPPSGISTKHLLTILAGAVLGLGALHALVSYAHGLQSGQVQHLGLVPELRARVFDKLQRLSFTFYDRNGSASIINRVTSDVQSARSFVDGVMLQGGILVLSLSVYAGFMLTAHAGLTFACLGATPLIWWLTRRFSNWAQSAYQKTRERVDEMVATMSEGVVGVVVTKVFGREREELARFDRKNDAVVDQQQEIFARASQFTAAVHFVSQLNVALLLGYGGHLVFDGSLSLGDLIVFANLLSQFAAQISAMARVVNTLEQSLAGARRVFEVLDLVVDVQSPERPIDAKSVLSRTEGGVRFEHVDFRYPSGQLALSDVSFDVPRGTCLGVLGPTGAGKTTLLSLVPRFYDASGGRICIGGHDVRDFDLDSLRRQLGVVFQQTLLFKQSVFDNIAFGYPGASRADVERAARIALAHEFVERLPNGYDTLLAEEGANLSGGQRQRLALARAVLIEPRVLLLDDPTTALDPGTEAEVLVAMRQVMMGRTTLIVANRLSTLRFADRVIVIENGHVTEQGTHRELMAARGAYYKTAELQGFAGVSAAFGQEARP